MATAASTSQYDHSKSAFELFQPHPVHTQESIMSSPEVTVTTTAAPVLERKRSKSSVRFAEHSTGSSELLRCSSTVKLVDCQYKIAGCKEKVPQGTLVEKEHAANCRYRPIPCLMQNAGCSELVPYQNFFLHHMKHFLIPTFTTTLNIPVYFEREDFQSNQRWNPRWMNCYGRDFFVMLSHKIPGMWYTWIWMLGTPEEAEDYHYDIEISKHHLKKSGTFPVLSLRTTTDDIEKSESCLSMTDFQVQRISQIQNNVVGYFEMNVVIYKSRKTVSQTQSLSETQR